MESVCEAMFITDVTIVTATDTLRAHRSILSAHSPFLAFLLGEQESLEEDPVLIFPNHSSFVVRWDFDNLVDKYLNMISLRQLG